MFAWVKEFWDGLNGWFVALWAAVVAFFTDLPLKILDGFLSAVASLVETIPAPSFLPAGGLQTWLNALDPAVLFFLDRSGFDVALAILGAAFVFRMARKIVTLGQW